MPDDEALVAMLEPITLEGLNTKSELLDRQECKYAVHRDTLPHLFASLGHDFYVLEHVGRRVFRYESVYFDDGYDTYWQHFRGRRRRFKVRTRLYADSRLCFLELKLKKRRGSTDKRRIKYPVEDRFILTDDARDFLRDSYQKAYGAELTLDLRPSLIVANDRVTLVRKDGGERLTIDMNLRFATGEGEYEVPPGFVVIETKSRNGNGLCDRYMRMHGGMRVRGCSKYCIGVAKLGLVSKTTTFKPVIRVIDLIERRVPARLTQEPLQESWSAA